MTVRTLTAGAVSLALATAMTACGDDETSRRRRPRSSRALRSHPRPPTSRDGTPIRVRHGDNEFTGRLADSDTARALADQLPVTITFRDHNAVEKTGALPDALPVAGDEADDPAAGDIGYYAPGSDLVFYYGDAPAFDGIVVLGSFDAGTAALEDQDGTVTMTVERG